MVAKSPHASFIVTERARMKKVIKLPLGSSISFLMKLAQTKVENLPVN